MHSDLDVMPVRADEQFNYQAIQTYLQTHVAHAEGPLEVRQFGGGHANLTYLLRMGEQEWVMRRPPLGPTLPVAPAVNEAGITLGLRRVPAAMVTPGAVPVSIVWRPIVVVASANVPVAPETGGLRMPPRVIDALPGRNVDPPPLCVTVIVCPATEGEKNEPSGPVALSNEMKLAS